MKVLILDDMPDRIGMFALKFVNHDITIVNTAPNCIEMLNSFQWDAVFLDHDLGGEVYCKSDENSGYAVAKFMEEAGIDKQPKHIILHSLNPAGVKNMQYALPRAKTIPFAWIKGVATPILGVS